jgi:pimeloyl-ACP methyl ester carboxylesterase
MMARELDAEPEFPVERIVLFNGSILLHLAKPILGQRLLRSRFGPQLSRFSSRPVFVHQLGSVFSQGHPMSREEAEDQWSLTSNNAGNRIGHRLIAYMDERIRKADRWHGAIANWPGDLSFVWALQDRVATPAVYEGLRTLRPGALTVELPDLGHYPQIESPGEFAAAIGEAFAG